MKHVNHEQHVKQKDFVIHEAMTLEFEGNEACALFEA